MSVAIQAHVLFKDITHAYGEGSSDIVRQPRSITWCRPSNEFLCLNVYGSVQKVVG